MVYTLYRAISPSKKYYVGITSRDFELRKEQHILDAENNSPLKFHQAIRKYKEAIQWEIIATIQNSEEAFELERYFINKHDSYKNGYNMTPGGLGRGRD